MPAGKEMGVLVTDVALQRREECGDHGTAAALFWGLHVECPKKTLFMKRICYFGGLGKGSCITIHLANGAKGSLVGL